MTFRNGKRRALVSLLRILLAAALARHHGGVQGMGKIAANIRVFRGSLGQNSGVILRCREHLEARRRAL